MTLFITSSPFVEGADRAILSNANGFVDRIRQALPPTPRAPPPTGGKQTRVNKMERDQAGGAV